jgi:hypothetical protein
LLKLTAGRDTPKKPGSWQNPLERHARR